MADSTHDDMVPEEGGLTDELRQKIKTLAQEATAQALKVDDPNPNNEPLRQIRSELFGKLISNEATRILSNPQLAEDRGEHLPVLVEKSLSYFKISPKRVIREDTTRFVDEIERVRQGQPENQDFTAECIGRIARMLGDEETINADFGSAPITNLFYYLSTVRGQSEGQFFRKNVLVSVEQMRGLEELNRDRSPFPAHPMPSPLVFEYDNLVRQFDLKWDENTKSYVEAEKAEGK